MSDIEKTEKITINIGLVDLGEIDLLVDEGFFTNRTDFIRTAIRRQLATRADAAEYEALRDAGQTIELRVLGLATIDDDVTPELAAATIASVEVLGAFRASRGVKAALASRTR